MPFALTRQERIYLQIAATYGIIPNTTGAATVANANACRHIKATLDNTVATIQRQDKTGSRSATPGARGRSFGKWSLEMSLAPNGTAGVKPDCDPVIQGFMGAIGAATTAIAGNGFPAGTTVVDASPAYKYTLSDSIIPFILWSFRSPSTVDQRVANACTVSKAMFNVGQDQAATWTAEGEAKYVLRSKLFAASDADMKGGLTAFPSEPSAPITNGGIIPGFTGKALVGGTVVSTLRNGSFSIEPGNAQIKDTFGSWTPTDTEGDARKVSTRISMYEDDQTGYATMLDLAHSKVGVDIVYQIGTVPGSIVVAVLKGVELETPTLEEERRYTASFPDSMAKGSSLTAKDELVLWFC